MRRLLVLFLFVSSSCFAQTATLGVYAMKLTASATDLETFKATGRYDTFFLDGLSGYLVATLVMGSDTLRVESDLPGLFDFGEIKPGQAELIIENSPLQPDVYEPYSEHLCILPGDNVVFAELKTQGPDNNPILPLLGVSSEDMKRHPMPVRLEQDGLHYAVESLVLKMKDNETFRRLSAFPGVTIHQRELVLSGEETTFSRVNDTLIFSYSK